MSTTCRQELVCVSQTEHIPPGKLTKPHIGHICVPEVWSQRSKVVKAWPGTIDSVRLSDHSAAVVEVQGGASLLSEEI